MRSYKTKGIIIKRINVGEADIIFLVFSKDFGKISLKARGVRKILAKLKGHLEMFSYSHLEIHKSRSSIDVITGAETIRFFKNIRNNLSATSRVYFLSEFLGRVLPEGEKQEKIFDWFLYTLKEINKTKKRERRAVLSIHFCLQTLKELGYYPHFRECIRCGNALEMGGNYFDLNGAGTVCPKCNVKKDYFSIMPISDRAVVGLRLLIENNKSKLDKIKMPLEILEEIYSIVERYVEIVADDEIKSEKFVKKVD